MGQIEENKEMSWSRKPIVKSKDDSWDDKGPSLSSMSSLTRFEQLDGPWQPTEDIAKTARIVNYEPAEEWEVIDKKSVPKVPKVKPKINHLLQKEHN